MGLLRQGVYLGTETFLVRGAEGHPADLLLAFPESLKSLGELPLGHETLAFADPRLHVDGLLFLAGQTGPGQLIQDLFPPIGKNPHCALCGLELCLGLLAFGNQDDRLPESLQGIFQPVVLLEFPPDGEPVLTLNLVVLPLGCPLPGDLLHAPILLGGIRPGSGSGRGLLGQEGERGQEQDGGQDGALHDPILLA